MDGIVCSDCHMWLASETKACSVCGIPIVLEGENKNIIDHLEPNCLIHRYEGSDMLEPAFIIKAGKTHSHYLRDLWHYRELFYTLAWCDIIVRYKQTVIRVAWSVIRPLLGMIVFTVIFGKIAKLPSDGTNYFLMVYAGIMIWQFFVNLMN